MPIGSIISVVAVLLTHMLRNAVATMTPRISWRGLVPMNRITISASRLCRSHFCIASASMKPPMNRKTVGEAYGAVASPTSITPSSGKATIGTSAVTASGSASVIHQTAIITTTAAVVRAADDRARASASLTVVVTCSPPLASGPPVRRPCS